ncbi:4-demethylwyosine synthase TYW1 [Nanoarchaeota archaeon]
MKLSDENRALLEKQQYGIVGEHSACKICSWTKKSLRGEGDCYKSKFYGIRSWLCCQMTPNLACCNACLFCWRDVSNFTNKDWDWKTDFPETIYKGCIEEQKRLLSGFGGLEKVDKEKLDQEPMHFALSLTGEATQYPKLKELIELIHKKGKTTFLVTNGQYPEALKDLEPTQFYVSIDAPNEELLKKIDRSAHQDSWQRLMKTLEILKTKKRSSLRITLIKDLNMVNPEQYAELIKKAEAKFVEVKAYMWVGSSQERLPMDAMPRHEEVVEFAQSIAEEAGYKIIDSQKQSRVVLLMKEDSEDRIMKF